MLGKSRPVLEERIGYHPDVKIALKRWGLQHANALYLGSIFSLSLLILTLISFEINLPVLFQSGSPLQWISVLMLAIAFFVPILTVSSSLVNWLITLRIKPRILPKLHFKDEIPAPFQTLVVIPALITSHEEIDNLTHQLELHFLRNPEPGLLFALLTDFRDADSETLPEDEELINYATAAIEKLNAKYEHSIPDCNTTADGSAAQLIETGNNAHDEQSTPPIVEGPQLFYLLHRKRLWNQSEGRWMGWERKRGKLHELNRLLRGGKDLSFSTIAGDTKEQRSITMHSIS